jgi:sulfoxide reductase catalytic subunit YedY
MTVKRPADIRWSEVTPSDLYVSRRRFITSMAGVLAASTLAADIVDAAAADRLVPTKRLVTTTEAQTPYSSASTFNNFYEFGSGKADPARNAKGFTPRPWMLSIEGQCAKPGIYALDDILKPHPLEERVYRMRCVEGWSMVIPWIGFPLGDLIKRFEPNGNARFVEFTTMVRPQEMVGQRQRFPPLLPWPYTEGLRMDEAMHPLAILAVGMYGQELPNQNGAPLRLVVPWKYGFKGIKSIVKIRFVEIQPMTTWSYVAPEYYAFYSNVNPGFTSSTFRDQSTERRIGDFLMRKTLMFNGYADEVGSLYANMNLQRNY